MKFGQEFQGRIGTYPDKWSESAIPYKYLKKVLGRVRGELLARGYDPTTIRTLVANHAAEYRLLLDQSRVYHPELTIHVGQVDDRPLTGDFCSSGHVRDLHLISGAKDTSCHPGNEKASRTGRIEDTSSKWIRVPLAADDEFFGLIGEDVDKLTMLQEEEEISMKTAIVRLGDQVAALAKPHRLHKTDLNRWREILELYVQAEVFFSTCEADKHTARTSDQAVEKLAWFQKQIASRGVLEKFKISASAEAYSQFLSLNLRLLQMLNFRELNQTALAKIIKKFDKQTCLGVTTAFEGSLQSKRFITENVAKGICAELSKGVVSRVPRLYDHRCPVCWDLCYNPIRLECQHLFCRQCIVGMQIRSRNLCPLCRAPVVLKATEASMDETIAAFMEKWFPKEAKAKQAEWEVQRRKDTLDPSGEHVDCIIM